MAEQRLHSLYLRKKGAKKKLENKAKLPFWYFYSLSLSLFCQPETLNFWWREKIPSPRPARQCSCFFLALPSRSRAERPESKQKKTNHEAKKLLPLAWRRKIKEQDKKKKKNAFGNAIESWLYEVVSLEQAIRWGCLGKAEVFASLSHSSVHLLSQLLIGVVFREIELCNR